MIFDVIYHKAAENLDAFQEPDLSSFDYLKTSPTRSMPWIKRGLRCRTSRQALVAMYGCSSMERNILVPAIHTGK